MIDLRGQGDITSAWEISEDDGSLKITFLNDADDVFGDLIIEGNKSRSLLDSLYEIGKTVFTDLDFGLRVLHRTKYEELILEAKTIFSEDIVSSPAPAPEVIDLRGETNFKQLWEQQRQCYLSA